MHTHRRATSRPVVTSATLTRASRTEDVDAYAMNQRPASAARLSAETARLKVNCWQSDMTSCSADLCAAAIGQERAVVKLFIQAAASEREPSY